LGEPQPVYRNIILAKCTWETTARLYKDTVRRRSAWFYGNGHDLWL